MLEADVVGGPLSLETSGDGLISFGQVTLNGRDQVPGSGLGSAKSLCSAVSGHSSGAFTCGGTVYLGVPGSTPVGHYTGVLTLTLV